MIPFLSHTMVFTDLFNGFPIFTSCLAAFPNQDYINIHVPFLQILLWSQALHWHSEPRGVYSGLWQTQGGSSRADPRVSGSRHFGLQRLGTFLPELMLQGPASYSSSRSGQAPTPAPRGNHAGPRPGSASGGSLGLGVGGSGRNTQGPRERSHGGSGGVRRSETATWPCGLLTTCPGARGRLFGLLSTVWLLSFSEFGSPLMLFPSILPLNQGWGAFLPPGPRRYL